MLDKSCYVIGYIFFMSLLQACTYAKPWEDQYHNLPEMSFTPDPLDKKISDRMYQDKEISASESVGSDGGCGCN